MREAHRPPQFAQRAPALLCFLHGFGEAAPLALQPALTLHGPLSPGNPAEARESMIVLAPQLPAAGDTWHLYADAVRELAQAVAHDNACDPARLYLTGFSYGGNGVFDLALAQSQLWAACWAVDPTRVPPRRIPAPVFVSIGNCARGQLDLYIERLGLAPATDRPHGAHLWKDEGLDHVATAASAYRDPAIYRWLKNQRRAP